MKILLVGNYMLTQRSMQKFAEMLKTGLQGLGHDVRLIRPLPIFGWPFPERSRIRKWFGYVDQFVLFPMRLAWASGWADITHVCDHSNAMYLSYVRGQAILTCHDLLGIRSANGAVSENKVGLTGRVLQRWIRASLEKAPFVVCVSKATADDLAEITTVPSEKVTVVQNALNYPFGQLDADTARQTVAKFGVNMDRPFFMHVGSNVWYKNRPGVLRLFAALREKPEFREHSLVMAGQPLTSELQALIRELQIENEVTAVADVTDEQLDALYSVASALLFPSLQEGFGWPVIEAQACGCLVVTSDKLPMREVAGGGAILIDPTAPHDAADRVTHEWSDRQELIERGSENVKRFSPVEMCHSYVRAYERVIEKRAMRHIAEEQLQD